MITEAEIRFIAAGCGTEIIGTTNIIEMLEEGSSVPFISRYRKEQTGNMDEELVNLVSERYDFLKEINIRKATILKTIDQQGKLSEEIKKEIRDCYSSSELEDLYLPFKPKKRTKAVMAKEMGLQPLADDIIDPGINGTSEQLAEKFIIARNETKSIEEALEWAGYIIAEKFSENSKLRSELRRFLNN
ncbi:MAG: Tex-like N-terminal domain-containing protein, partial [Acidobacteriota bacterium]